MAAAPDPDANERIEEIPIILKCCTCGETLEEPKTLPCFHSFCKKCLATYFEDELKVKEREYNNAFECPKCKTQLNLKQGDGVEGILPNEFISNLLDILPVIKQQKEKLQCGSCKAQVSVECRCFECERYLCENCLTTHSKWPDFKQHVVMSLEDLAKPENQSKAKKKPRCDKQGHGSKHLEFYCNTCKELACMSCVVLDHPKPDHDYQPMDTEAEKQKEALKKTFDILQKTSTEVDTALNKIGSAIGKLQVTTEEAKVSIKKQEKEICEVLSKKVEHKAAILIGQVNRKLDAQNRELEKQQCDMKAYHEKVNGSLDFAKNIIERASSEEVILLGRELQLNAEVIKKERPDRMEPIHDGTIEYQAKPTGTIVDNINLNDLGNVVSTCFQQNDRPIPSRRTKFFY
ncbi:E3 ubiquitin-protein ligase TRIM33-like [Dendronephthya gigantea]|uniref:E3 ubiquitin-protein ligase TRIM33-like n=1 Tax=Dendronephthya gigantea TaxID=151771 RepID=UPI00106D8FAB|nr:E3 ubiquitin-protein ligase TRIM33-like [Dendronephthya gigantea]